MKRAHEITYIGVFRFKKDAVFYIFRSASNSKPPGSLVLRPLILVVFAFDLKATLRNFEPVKVGII